MKCRNCLSEFDKNQEIKTEFCSILCKKKYRRENGFWRGLLKFLDAIFGAPWS